MMVTIYVVQRGRAEAIGQGVLSPKPSRKAPLLSPVLRPQGLVPAKARIKLGDPR